KHEEHRRILGERVRQLDVARAILPLDQERKDRAHSVGLRLERIVLEGRGVVLDVQLLEPLEIVAHEAGTEANGVPGFQVLIDSSGLLPERLVRRVELAVVMKIVDTDLEPLILQETTQRPRQRVLALGHKVERRPEAETHLELGELTASRESPAS